MPFNPPESDDCTDPVVENLKNDQFKSIEKTNEIPSHAHETKRDYIGVMFLDNNDKQSDIELRSKLSDLCEDDANEFPLLFHCGNYDIQRVGEWDAI